jgi:RES domain-containing protein
MIVFRLTKAKHAKDFSGKGAELSGGRWNNKGIPVLYTSESRALCLLEVAVHLPLGNLPQDFVIVSLDVPDKSMYVVDVRTLPADWKEHPPKPETRMIGDQFVAQGKYLLLKVPSALVQDEYNYLVNPRHKEAGKLKILSIDPFTFDSRFFNR